MNKTHSILIVDDDPGIINVLTLILTNAGYNVTGDLTGELRFLQTGVTPDLILLDNQLGEKSGLSICYALKHSPVTSDIPIILESADEDLDKLAAKACADDYLAKPFSIKVLLKKIEMLVERSPVRATA